MTTNGDPRGHWASSAGFVLAAAGSAIGLGNLWRFPYITGENGGGLFVLIYLFFIAAVGIPILLAEILIGRAAARSPVGAMRELAGPRSPWVGIGGLSVTAATLVLSVYAVAAGWGMHYVYLGATGHFKGLGPQEVGALFGEVHASAGINLFWAVLFMALTVGIVLGGVHKGIERASQILMPALLLMLLALLGKALTLDGFGEAFGFVFGLHADRLTPAGVLEALGHAFFTLGVGGGVMLTYGPGLFPNHNSTTCCIQAFHFYNITKCLIRFHKLVQFIKGLRSPISSWLVYFAVRVGKIGHQNVNLLRVKRLAQPAFLLLQFRV